MLLLSFILIPGGQVNKTQKALQSCSFFCFFCKASDKCRFYIDKCGFYIEFWVKVSKGRITCCLFHSWDSQGQLHVQSPDPQGAFPSFDGFPFCRSIFPVSLYHGCLAFHTKLFPWSSFCEACFVSFLLTFLHFAFIPPVLCQFFAVLCHLFLLCPVSS